MKNLIPETFFFDLPIYTPIKITEENFIEFRNLLEFKAKLDGYNPFIKEQTTFEANGGMTNSFEVYAKYGGVNKLSIRCLRTNAIFTFYIHYDSANKTFMKVGQYPSIADFHISQIKQYNRILSIEKLKEFTRAIGLAANGVGIGSFVYLRRIFEELIEEAHSIAKDKEGWDEDIYSQKRIVEKIELLKSHLPSFLYENRTLYGILSVGIHSLKEEDCLAYFDAVKVGIELILDEKLDELKKKQKIDEGKRKLAELTSKLGKK